LRTVRRVTRALFKIAHRFIYWPSGEQAQTVIKKFKESSKFPSTIGAIDGTHIKIEAPKENAADYINQKGYYSIQLQVCKIVKLFLITILTIDIIIIIINILFAIFCKMFILQMLEAFSAEIIGYFFRYKKIMQFQHKKLLSV